MVRIAPSIASGPLTNLSSTLNELEDAGANLIHFDIEDGSFVPEMNLGIKVIKEMRALTKLPFDVHLMMHDPEWVIPILADSGVDMVSVHFEACPYPRRTLQLIASHKMEAGLAFNPATPIPDLSFCQPYLSFILVLTTDPEIKDPMFLAPILKKIRSGKLDQDLEKITWVADGAISALNATEVVNAGADIMVIGRGIFGEGKISENFSKIRKVCKLIEK